MHASVTFFRTAIGLSAVLIALNAGGQTAPKSLAAPEEPRKMGATETLGKLPLAPPAPAKAAFQDPARYPVAGARQIPAPPAGHIPAPPAGALKSEQVRVELVSERYPDGRLKLERYVLQDARGNYINHGTYTLYAPDGKILKKGDFQNGKQEGEWVQHFANDAGNLFSSEQQRGFTGPFVSTATFSQGKMLGVWTIQDAQGKNIITWGFENGARHGQWTWWHSNGQKWLEATYRNGTLHGEVKEWDTDGKVVSQSNYIDGRCLVNEVGWYALGQKHYQGAFLRVQRVPEPVFDWWTSSVTSMVPAPTGADQKHGVWIAWYRNGNKKTQGEYDHDTPIGKFTWWYENGQRQAEGEFDKGGRSGTWITWHANGLKESQASYVHGKVIGTWMRWDTDGKLVGARDFNLERRTADQRATNAQRPAANNTRR